MNRALALMLFVTLLQVPLAEIGSAFRHVRFLATLLVSNLVAIPAIVLLLLQIVPEEPMVRLGVLMMPDPPRTASGHRIYDDSHVARLRFILRARELGFAIEQIRGLLDLVDGGTQTCAEVKERTERHLADVRAKIADLRRIEKVLASTAAQCSGDEVPECPVLKALAS